ncbi:uncharacterized protein LOC103314275 [Tribolium castaneum]|uniref:Uncharacterized protein n=1 Tax=Tribolium castaneum TaxID=7070 RepID=A0A139WBK4_TRICA|nr:PREDICTED: uncharacterized protein LOC103314275 [Tribolium castaneum]KYB25280.1 hypothetical protein TcasGA2_TC034395 [Tribolium castaneum]|eukprot:XP_008198056.1 PREDICTED: uncharacterized protein LOC103314275 [Tribolium castaneum]
MSSVSKNSKTQKKSASRLSQRKHQERGSEQKFLQRKVFTKSSRPPSTNQYKVVNVPCKIPSAFIVPKKDSIKKETKKAITNDWELKLQKFREKQQEIKEKYSPKMRELYVNPKKLKRDSISELHRARVPEIVAEPIKTNDGGDDETEPVQFQEKVFIKQEPIKLEDNAKSLITLVTFEQEVPRLSPEIKAKANELITEAHRMIWHWLFRGLFPPAIIAAKHK